MTNSLRSNSNATGSKPATFIESVHNDGCWFTDFLLPSDVVEQSVLENGDIDSVPPMDPNHNSAAVGFLAMESVCLVKHCDWDPLAAPSRRHHSPLPTAQPSQQIPLPGNQQQQSMESVGLIKQSVTENGDIDSFILHQNRAHKQSSAPNWTLLLRGGKLRTCMYSL